MKSTEFERFVQANTKRLLAAAVLLCGDEQAAEDLVQEALLAAHRHWKKVRGAGSPPAYVRKILVNRFLDEQRRPRLPTRPLDSDLPVADPRRPPDEVVVGRGELAAALACLPPKQRACLVLRYLEDLDFSEIAALMETSESTVRSNTSRAIEGLRGALLAHDRQGDRHVN